MEIHPSNDDFEEGDDSALLSPSDEVLHREYVRGVLDAKLINKTAEYLDAEQILREFINSHILAMKFVSAPSVGPYDSVRHEPRGCKHCEALGALDSLTHIVRAPLSPDKDELITPEEASRRLFNQHDSLATLMDQRDELKAQLESCNVQLHDKSKHELGLKCAIITDIAYEMIEWLDKAGFKPLANIYRKQMEEA